MRRNALLAGFCDGLAAAGTFVASALSPVRTARERAVYRGDGIEGDIKAVGGDMWRATGGANPAKSRPSRSP